MAASWRRDCGAVEQFLTYREDRANALYMLAFLLVDYYGCKDDREISFRLPIEDLFPQIRAAFEDDRDLLKNDKRWAGVEWNSKCGLWYPVVRALTRVRDDFGGPDLMPSRPGCDE
jgi:hypothetical protein